MLTTLTPNMSAEACFEQTTYRFPFDFFSLLAGELAEHLATSLTISNWRDLSTGKQVTSSGHPYLSAALGSVHLVLEHTVQCVEWWVAGLALTLPHASYSAFTHDFLQYGQFSSP